MSDSDKKTVAPGDLKPSRYSCAAKAFHWIVAGLVLFQFLKLSDRIAEGAHFVSQSIKPYHGSIGFVILIVAILRIIWRWYDRESRPKVERLANLYHRVLYVLLLFVPISALCLMVGKGYGVKVFGIQLVPRSAEGVEWLATIGGLHSPLAIIMAIMVFGHVAMALYHQFVKKDAILEKML